MTVEIPPDLQQFVQQAVGGGSYKSEAEVVGQALGCCNSASNRLRSFVARFNRPWIALIAARESSWTRMGWMRSSKTSRLAVGRNWRRSDNRNEALSPRLRHRQLVTGGFLVVADQ